MREELIKKILNSTEEGYDLIADKFSQTRSRFWKELDFIGKFAKSGNRVLDFGCGNGRLLEILSDKDIDYAGVDVSQNLIDLARNNQKNKYDFKKINFLKIGHDFRHLPFQNDSFDVIYSIAVFHHLPGSKKRLEIAKELFRLTKRDGYILVTVWNLWNPRYRKNIFRNWRDKFLFKSELEFNDCYISFTDNQGQKFNRFHHAFTRAELRKLFIQAGFRVINCKIIKGNLVLLGKKL